MKNLVYALVGAGFMIACQPSDQPEIRSECHFTSDSLFLLDKKKYI